MKLKNIALALVAVSSLYSINSYSQSGGQAVVTVNGTKIYQRQVDEMVKAEVARGATDNAQLRQGVLEDLVFREAVMQDVKKKGLATQPDNEFRIRMAQQTAIVDIWFAQYMKSHPISEADVKGEYDKLVALSKEPKNANEYLFSDIVVGTEAEAKEVIASANMGTDFATLAKEKSLDKQGGAQGGQMNWSLPGKLLPAIGDALLTTGKGKVDSTPIKTDYGWVVLKVNDIRPFKVPPYDEVKQGIASMMVQAEKQKAIQQLMSTAKITKG